MEHFVYLEEGSVSLDSENIKDTLHYTQSAASQQTNGRLRVGSRFMAKWQPSHQTHCQYSQIATWHIAYIEGISEKKTIWKTLLYLGPKSFYKNSRFNQTKFGLSIRNVPTIKLIVLIVLCCRSVNW